jgi:hypothetical protein
MPSADSRELRDVAYELKFLVDPATGARIREWSRARLDPDPYGQGPAGDEYLTTTLYFDTRDFDVLHRNGSYGRAKYRVRRYDGERSVFLERKLRREARLCKRRTTVPLDALGRVEDPDAAWEGAWFARRLALRQLHPVCQIAYHRTARVAARARAIPAASGSRSTSAFARCRAARSPSPSRAACRSRPTRSCSS